MPILGRELPCGTVPGGLDLWRASRSLPARPRPLHHPQRAPSPAPAPLSPPGNGAHRTLRSEYHRQQTSVRRQEPALAEQSRGGGCLWRNVRAGLREHPAGCGAPQLRAGPPTDAHTEPTTSSDKGGCDWLRYQYQLTSTLSGRPSSRSCGLAPLGQRQQHGGHRHGRAPACALGGAAPHRVARARRAAAACARRPLPRLRPAAGRRSQPREEAVQVRGERDRGEEPHADQLPHDRLRRTQSSIR